MTRLRADDGSHAGTFPVASAPTGLAFDGLYMWVANTGSSTVTRLRSNGANPGDFVTGNSPLGVAFDGVAI